MSLYLAVLGDSIAAGQGATRPADTLGPRLVAGLAEHDMEATAGVFASSGARSSWLSEQVDRALRWSPHVAVVVVGANDVSHRVPPELAAQQLRDAVRRLRDADAQVVVAPAPDLSSVPYVPTVLRPAVSRASSVLRALQTEAVLAEGGRVADTAGATSVAFTADPSLFSADRFHPSSAGYAVIASALLPEVLAAVAEHHEAQHRA